MESCSNASVAQVVEQETENLRVGSASLSQGTTNSNLTIDPVNTERWGRKMSEGKRLLAIVAILYGVIVQLARTPALLEKLINN